MHGNPTSLMMGLGIGYVLVLLSLVFLPVIIAIFNRKCSWGYVFQILFLMILFNVLAIVGGIALFMKNSFLAGILIYFIPFIVWIAFLVKSIAGNR